MMATIGSVNNGLIKSLIFSFFIVTTLHAKSFRVVIDPGHGGRTQAPYSVYGDKYDPVRGVYLDKFRSGAYSSGLYEHEVVYEIARRTQEILKLTDTPEGRLEFHKILQKYNPNFNVPEEPIRVFLSRPSGHRAGYFELAEDVNAPYRLYDYPDLKTGEMKSGTISRINAYQPHLVVSLHLTNGRAGEHGAMASVVTPGYQTYSLALDYVRGNKASRKIIQENFTGGPYRDWFVWGKERSAFEWFLCDAWIYFTGYWSTTRGLEPDYSYYRGLRHYYVQWNYIDPFWMIKSVDRQRHTSYSPHLKTFIPSGAFWEREMSRPEHWRREGGYESFGGDNLYASNEILRYIRKGLFVDGVRKKKELPELRAPYLSTWSVPTMVNAISAYLEIGYMNNSRDYDRLHNNKKTHAEAIAAGIYSLLYGVSEPDQKPYQKDYPKGHAIDFQRYMNYGKRGHFASVVPESHEAITELIDVPAEKNEQVE